MGTYVSNYISYEKLPDCPYGDNYIQQEIKRHTEINPSELNKWLEPNKWNPFDSLIELSKLNKYVVYHLKQHFECNPETRHWNIHNGNYAHALVIVKNLIPEEILEIAMKRNEAKEKEAKAIGCSQ